MALFMDNIVLATTAALRINRNVYEYVHCVNIPGQFDVVLRKDKNNRCAVQYGKQHKYDLSEVGAAHEYGECILHALSCAGVLD
jgi:uncharacterized protein YhfF